MKTINIKGKQWAIKKVENEAAELEGADGVADVKKKVIYLSKTPSNHTKNNLFWHEYFHAFFHECGIRDLDSSFEHVIIENLSDLMERLDNNGKLKRKL